MSIYIYKKIFFYKYKLFIYFKDKLGNKINFFFKFIKFMYKHFIHNLKISLLSTKKILKLNFKNKFPSFF